MCSQVATNTQVTRSELTARQKAWRKKKEALCRLLPVDRLSALPNLPPDMFDPGSMCCPWHDDSRPSCSHWVCDEGYPLWKCHAGCGVKGPLDVVQLSMAYAPFGEVWVRAVVLAGGAASLAGLHVSDEDLQRLRKPPVHPPARCMQTSHRKISAEPEVLRWMLGRGLSSDFVEGHGLAYATPSGHSCPGIMITGKSDWHSDGYKLVFTPIDAEGRRCTYRARRTGRDQRGEFHSRKSRVPAGYGTDGTILVNGPAWRFFVPRLDEAERELLAFLLPDLPTDPGPLPTVLEIAEGEPDWLLRCELAPAGTAVVGIWDGAWTLAFADKIPDGTLVKIYCHSDEAGQKYQHEIAASLRGRCPILVRHQRLKLVNRWVDGDWKKDFKFFDEVEIVEKLGRAEYLSSTDEPANMAPYLPPEAPSIVAGRPVVARAEPRAPEAPAVEAPADAPELPAAEPVLAAAVAAEPAAEANLEAAAAAPAPAPAAVPAPAPAAPKRAGRPSVAQRLVELVDAHGVRVAANDRHELVGQVPTPGGKFVEVPLTFKKFGPLLLAWAREAGLAPPSKPTVEQAIATLAAGVKVQLVGAEPAEADGEILGFHDADNATRIECAAKGRAIHSKESGWMVLSDGVWVRDHKRIVRLTEEAMRKIPEEARFTSDEDLQQAVRQWGVRSLSKPAIQAAIDLASSRESLSVREEDLDRDPFLLGMARGVLDLRTGRLVDDPARHLVTRRLPVSWDPAARAPRWVRFIAEVCGGDQELADFLQRLLGYCLTGSVQEQCLFVFHGPRANNGKSTLLDVLLELFGDEYAHKSNHEMLSDERAKGSHGTDRNQQRGRRLMILDEWPRGAGFDEAHVKTATGGKRQAGRGIQQDESNFRATAKFLIGTNYVIEISGEDRGVWRRVIVVPFLQAFDPTANPTLYTDLIAELPGILAWLAEGATEWYRRSEAFRAEGRGRSGLDVPPVVRAYTDKIRGELDDVGRWAEERMYFGPTASATPTEVAASWASWCDENKIPAKAASRITSRSVRAVVEQRWGHQGVGGDGRRIMGLGVLSGLDRTQPGRNSKVDTGSSADLESLLSGAQQSAKHGVNH